MSARSVDSDAEFSRRARRPDDHVPPGRDLRSLLETIARERRTAAVFAAIALALGAVQLVLATPAYESTTILQVDDTGKRNTGADDLLAGFVEKTAAETEIEILRSRTLLGAVVDRLQLDVSAAPVRFPVVGRVVASLHRGPELAEPWLGLSRFAWGGEQVQVGRLAVPDALVDEPLTLTATGNDRWQLTGQGGQLLLRGTVGQAAQSNDGATSLLVTTLIARPGTEFRLVLLDRIAAIREFARGLQISEKGRKSGVIQLTLDGEDPARIALVLNTLTSIYLRQHTDRRSAEADQTLHFLESQIQTLQPSVRKAETALNDFQQRRGSVNLSHEAEAMVNQVVEIEKEISTVQLELMALSHKYTEKHPLYAAAADRLAALVSRRTALEQRMRELPRTELDSARLTRDVKVSSELYGTLLNKVQELRVLKPGIVGNIRVVDAALVSRRPIGAPTPVVLAAMVLVAGFFGVGAAFARRALRDVVDVPDDIEKHTGLPVYVAVPHSPAQEALCRRKEPVRDARRASVLASVEPTDLAVEALRSLRTALQFALATARNNVVALGSPAPGAGKSFVVSNLAVLLADTGRKVLLIDADLRRGKLHSAFGLRRTPGLTDVLAGSVTLEAALKTTSAPGLHLLPTGAIPPNPSELLASRRFEAMLATVSQSFELVIVDTPPVLAVTDATLVAGCAGVNLLVLRAGHQSMREINLALERFAQNGTTVQGAILNDARAVLGTYGRYGRRYDYEPLS
jgi:tyrosine-protein kinase Etk/Wzc